MNKAIEPGKAPYYSEQVVRTTIPSQTRGFRVPVDPKPNFRIFDSIRGFSHMIF